MSEDDGEDFYDSEDDQNVGASPFAAEREDAGFSAARDKSAPKLYNVQARSLTVSEVQNARRVELANAEQAMLIFGLDLDSALDFVRKERWTIAGLQAICPPQSPQMPSLPTLPLTNRAFCSICCEDELSPTYSLQCGHEFCTNCWAQYLEARIRDGGECTLRCMQNGCNQRVTDSLIKECCSTPVHDGFEVLSMQNYVESTSHLKFCPVPGCQETISCPPAASTSALKTIVPTVTCSYGHTFCFGCQMDEDHRPALCGMVKIWFKACRNERKIRQWRKKHVCEDDSVAWINANTKECPGCQSPIEKDGGCNHVTCKKCEHQFCWLCRSSWEGHSCNRYDSAGASRQRKKARARGNPLSQLEPFLHYHRRWANHEQSARLSAELARRKMEEMQRVGMLRWIDVQFMKGAIENALQCRRTLKWTYVMAYYLDESHAKVIFEENQQYLETAVEDFTQLLEAPTEPHTSFEQLSKLRNLANYLQKRNDIMLEDTAGGFKEGRWTWSEKPVTHLPGEREAANEQGHQPTDLANPSSTTLTDPTALTYDPTAGVYTRIASLVTFFYRRFWPESV